MAGYYTCFKYKSKEQKLHFSPNTSCFARLYSGNTSNVSTIQCFLFYTENNNCNHDTELNFDNIVKYFNYFKDLFSTQPIVEEILDNKIIRKELGDRYEDVEDFGFDTNKIIKITWDASKQSKVYIKFITTLTRYLYEYPKTNGKVVNKFMRYRGYKRYKNIPSIELFQLCHSDVSISGGHALFSSKSSESYYSTNNVVTPVKDTSIKKGLKGGGISLNGLFNVSRTKEIPFNFTKVIKKYNESCSIRK